MKERSQGLGFDAGPLIQRCFKKSFYRLICRIKKKTVLPILIKKHLVDSHLIYMLYKNSLLWAQLTKERLEGLGFSARPLIQKCVKKSFYRLICSIEKTVLLILIKKHLPVRHLI